MGRLILAGMGGLLLWLLAQWIAFGMAGAGHGWIAPLFFSMPLLLLYPLVTVRAVSSKPPVMKLDGSILAVAVALDLLLLRHTMMDELSYFLRTWSAAAGVVTLWLVLWAGWQVLAVAKLLGKARTESAAKSV